MDLGPFCERIDMPPQAAEFVRSYPLAGSDFDMYKNLFFEDRDKFFLQVHKDGQEPLFLVLFVRLALEAYQEYQKRNIPDEVYYDTFSDLAIWYRHYYNTAGRHGIGEYRWLWRHIRLRIFRLGRLQFEPMVPGRDIHYKDHVYYAGDPVLKVHIPRGSPLLSGECQDSYLKAARFFRGIESVFMCHSWLLSSALRKLLPPESNILLFQQPYFLYDQDMESRQGEEWIFGGVQANPGHYPDKTRLQRSAREYLMTGGKIGFGRGIFRLPS
jgi:hypothetical protein